MMNGGSRWSRLKAAAGRLFRREPSPGRWVYGKKGAWSGFLALLPMPRQKDAANSYRCWNWFDAATVNGHGEAAIVAAMIRSVRRWYRADPQRIIVVGMSAGGALAAVMGLRAPDLVRAVVVHSGIACGAAASAFTAIGVMQRGPETDVEAIAAQARGVDSPRVPLLAIHGESDNVVNIRNA